MIERYGGTIQQQTTTKSERYNLKMRAITHLYNEIKMTPTATEQKEIEQQQIESFLGSSSESEQQSDIHVSEKEQSSEEGTLDLTPYDTSKKTPSISASPSTTSSSVSSRGLVNNYNKCYQNSILQNWANLNEIMNVLPLFFDLNMDTLSTVSVFEWNDNMQIVRTLHAILTQINDKSNNDAVDPKSLINLLPQPWCNAQQHDCTEFYAYLTGILKWLIEKSANTPMLLWDIIQFSLKSIQLCENCGQRTGKVESQCEIQVFYTSFTSVLTISYRDCT